MLATNLRLVFGLLALILNCQPPSTLPESHTSRESITDSHCGLYSVRCNTNSKEMKGFSTVTWICSDSGYHWGLWGAMIIQVHGKLRILLGIIFICGKKKKDEYLFQETLLEKTCRWCLSQNVLRLLENTLYLPKNAGAERQQFE